MPVVKFRKPEDTKTDVVKHVETTEPVAEVKTKKKRVRKVKDPEPTNEPVEESTPAPVENVKTKKKRVRKVKDPEPTNEPVEESTPAPVTEVKEKKEKKPPSAWQLHVRKTFEDNKGSSFTEVMALAKSSYKK